jgi:small subunit ribosomal protein S6
MRKYELTVILPTDLKKEDGEKLLGKIKKAIDDGKGTIDKHDELGKKDFAYEINKQKEGFYYYWEFSVEPAQLPEVDRKIKAEEKILRYLLVKVE